MTTNRLRDRSGATLVELMIALLVSSLVLSTALGFLKQQTTALSLGTSQMRVVQNSRFAISMLRNNLRTAGTNVEAIQPTLVFASEDAMVFNADYAANTLGNAFAVYIDTTLADGEVSAMQKGERTELIPRSGMLYPDTTYKEAGTGTNSSAETISFYFAPDSTTTRTDDFALYRRVNSQPRVVVARNILRNGTAPFFEYLSLPNAASAVEIVPRTTLPLRHVTIHGSKADNDTSRSGLTDMIRAVRVNMVSTNGKTGKVEVKRATQQTIRLVNAGVVALEACGEMPVLGSISLAAARTINTDRSRRVTLTWQAAADEKAGEKDVLRYIVWRNTVAGGTDWGEPYLTISAGQTAYTYLDEGLDSLQTYRYAVAAQDCTPSMSTLATVQVNAR